MKNILSIAAIILLVSSCAISTHYLDTDAKMFSPSDKDKIEIFHGKSDHDFTVIGSIAIDVMGEGIAAKKKLMSEAAKLGADAVIYVKLTKLNSFAKRTGLSGVAVKYK